MLEKILKDPSFKLFENTIDFGEFEAVGYFSYSVAKLPDLVAVPRCIYTFIEENIKILPNKSVVVFKDKVNFGTENFCIYFKDAYCKIGKLDQIIKI